MDLRFTCLFLVAGLFLSSSAETEEGNNCEELIKPLTIEPSKLHGSWDFIRAFTNFRVFDTILEITTSSRTNVTDAAADSGHQLRMIQAAKINGTCVGSKANVDVNDTIASIDAANTTSTFKLLPSCDGCLTFYIESTFRDINKLLKVLKVDDHATDTVTVKALYLMSNGATIEQADHERFKEQASCVDLKEESKFIYKPEEGICEEDDVVHFLEY